MAARSGNSSRIVKWRLEHSSVVLGQEELVIWGGSQGGLPWVHGNENKKSVSARLIVLNLPSMKWNSVSTIGIPPAGVMDYSTTAIGKEMYLFDGGRCDSGNCTHNELYQLNTSDKVWRCIPCTNRPIKKYGCGFISYSYKGSDYLLALGGKGGKKPPAEPQIHSLYTSNSDSLGDYSTNEVHIMNVTTSPGQWISPTISGLDRPSAISHFSLHLIPHTSSQAVMFGGMTVASKTKQSEYSNDTFILSLTDNTVHFTKLRLNTICPLPRAFHASTIISTSTQDHLLVIGGRGKGTLAECWILNLASRKWSQIDLPDLISGRCDHSVSTVTLNNNTVWIIVTGGRENANYKVFYDAEVAMVVELGYNSESWWSSGNRWKVAGVWNTTQRVELIERMKRLKPTNTLLDNSTLTKMEGQESRQQLRETNSQVQQKDAVIQRKDQKLEGNAKTIQQSDDEIIQQNNVTIQRKEQLLQQNESTIQQLQSDIREKNNTIEQSLLQIQQKNDVIQRHKDTITQQRREIIGYHDNPSWLIERDEITVTGEVLGRGGWGEVKVGVFRGTRVAVKSLYDLNVNDHYLHLFSREMDLASRIRHPNLLQFIGAIKVGRLMIITELMLTSLRRELEKHSLLRFHIISIAIDVVSALNYLHSFRPCPILHRDVSSSNVLLEPSTGNNWKGKLSDYGSANLMDNISTSNPGCPVYSAPEASTPRLHSAAMDIYSFGILLLEMATSQFPSPVAHEREGSIQDIKWSAIKELVIQCTSTDPSLRAPTDTVLTLLRDMR